MRIIYTSLFLLLFLINLDGQGKDPFDLCDGYLVYTDFTQSVPNPSFEETSCCPQMQNDFACTDSWVSARLGGTPDFYHSCGYIKPAIQQAGLFPFPDGEAAVGGIIRFNKFVEVIGTCLNEPFEAGEEYILRIHVAYTPVGSENLCFNNHHGALTFTVYGNSDCSNLPYDDSNQRCPSEVDNSWVIIGSVHYNSSMSWVELEIPIVPDREINAIIFGPECDMDPQWNGNNYCTAFYYYDDITVSKLEFEKEIDLVALGHPCMEDYRIVATIDTFGGEWQWFLDGVELSGENSSTLEISANGYPSGIYSARYTMNGFCSVAQIEIDVELSDAPVPICPAPISVCVLDDPFLLPVIEPMGGIYSGPGVNGNMFDPTQVGPGTFFIQYTAFSINNCPGSCEFAIFVQEDTPLSCNDDLYLCTLDEIFLEGAYPFGGTYSGPGVEDNIFTPINVGFGEFEIEYFLVDGLCEQTCNFLITVHPSVPPVCPPDMTVCIDDGDIFIPDPSIPGGMYSGPGVAGNIFSPEMAGSGNLLIEYFVTDQFDCPGSCSLLISVEGGGQFTCPESLELCIGLDSFILIGAEPSGGRYFGPGVVNNILYPDQLSPGKHILFYTIDNLACLDTCNFEIEILDKLSATCPDLGFICVDADPIMLPLAQPAGGTYTGNGVISTNFDPNLAGIGTHTLVYELMDDGCTYTCTTEIEVKGLPIVEAPDDSRICINATSIMLTPGIPAGGTFTGQGVTGNIFDPNLAGAGIQDIKYEFRDQYGCSSSAIFNIEVVDFVPLDPIDEISCYQVDTAYITGIANATWSFSANNQGTALIDNPANSSIKVFGFSQSGSYTILREIDGICRDSIVITVDDDCDCIIQQNYISSDELLFCGKQDIEIEGAIPDPIGGIYLWEWSIDGLIYSPVPGIIDQQNYTLIDPDYGVYFFRRTYELLIPDSCISISNVIKIELIKPVKAGLQMEFPAYCQGQNQLINLSELLEDSESGGIWEEISSVPSYGNSFDPILGTILTDSLQSGIYRFNYIKIAQAPCVNDTAIVDIIIHSIPETQIEIQPDELFNCQISTISLSAQDCQNCSFQWYFEGELVLDEATVFIQESGTYKLIAEDSLTGCNSESEVFIGDNRQYPFVQIDPPTILTCAQLEIELNGSNSQTAPMIKHKWFDSDSNLLHENQLIIRVTEPGTYTLFSIDTINGCSNEEVVIVLEDKRLPDIDAGPGQILYCGRESTTLQPIINSPSGQWTIEWQTQTGAILSASNIPNIDVKGEGWYYAHVIDVENGCSNSDSVYIELTDLTFNILSADDVSICQEAEYGSIRIQTDGQAPLYYYVNGLLVGNQELLTNLRPGVYNIEVKDSLGCIVDTTVTIHRKDAINLIFPIRVVIEQGDTTELNPQIQGSLGQLTHIKWIPGQDISCDTCLLTQVWPEEDRVYEINIEDEWGCQGQGQIEIKVKRKLKIFVPTAFSPNGDGINDWFTFYGPDIFEITKLEIFDRWGDKVFENIHFPGNDPEQGWDGRFRKLAMMPNTFVYVAQVQTIQGEIIVLSGEVQLLK